MTKPDDKAQGIQLEFDNTGEAHVKSDFHLEQKEFEPTCVHGKICQHFDYLDHGTYYECMCHMVSRNPFDIDREDHACPDGQWWRPGFMPRDCIVTPATGENYEDK